jgi:hypothetical protein
MIDARLNVPFYTSKKKYLKYTLNSSITAELNSIIGFSLTHDESESEKTSNSLFQ